MPPGFAARSTQIEPFYVMEVVKAADRLEAAGRSIIHLSIGEPDFTAPPRVQQAALRAITEGRTRYTAAAGTAELREAIAGHYANALRVNVDPARIFVTAGASAALLLAFAALLEAGAEVLMPDPCYPCNRHFAALLGGRAQLVPCGPASRFQLTRELVADAWHESTSGALLASPSNPTGTSIDRPVLEALIRDVERRGGFVIVDEIYQGLTYGHAPSTALEINDRVVVINSFSKYFSMTGWRLGWLVVPHALASTIEKLAQNIYICPSAVAQRAAIACFDPESLAVYEDRRREFNRRRDVLVPALRRLGFDVPVTPDGAFYVYADVSRWSTDSWRFSFDLLERTGVCVVPGRDFGRASPERYVRISYATSVEQIEEAVRRIAGYVDAKPRPAGL